jgi:hypothetical protein
VTLVQIPAKAVAVEGDDVLAPATALLRGLNLLGKPEETADAGKPGAAFTGPPQSVALIEAGATAVSKWWATGLGASAIAAWSTVASWWGGQAAATQRVALWTAAIITAAAILGIAYLLGSDVRGRAAAAVATIEARCKLGDTLARTSEAAFNPTPPSPSEQFVALPSPLQVSYSTKPSAEESGWRAIALVSNAKDLTKYLVVKDADHEWVDAAQIKLVNS